MTIRSKSTAWFGVVPLVVARAGCDQGAPKAAAGKAGADKAEADVPLPPPAFEAALSGLDPNIWFGNVEQIDSERIGPETVTKHAFKAHSGKAR